MGGKNNWEEKRRRSKKRKIGIRLENLQSPSTISHPEAHESNLRRGVSRKRGRGVRVEREHRR